MEKFEKGQEIWAVGIGSDYPYIIGPFEYVEPYVDASTSLHCCKSENGSNVILGNDRITATKRQAIVLAKTTLEEEIEAGEEALLKMKGNLADFCVTHNIKR